MEIFIIIFLIVVLGIGVVLFYAARLVYRHYFKNKIDMESQKPKLTESLAFKAATIAFLTLLLLIPNAMIQNLIQERQDRSRETIRIINDRWSRAQTLCAPLLLIPYTTTTLGRDNNPVSREHTLFVTPRDLSINVILTPEVRNFGIYRAILYRSNIHFKGKFSELSDLRVDNSILHFDRAQIVIGVSDLRGVAKNPDFRIGDKAFETTVGAVSLPNVSGRTLVVNLKDVCFANDLHFKCTMKLNGSGSISFIPVGQNTTVTIDGQWASPSFIGSFSPESNIDNRQFGATWNILSFNREIPEMWTDNNVPNIGNTSFGVNLIETVDHYQQNMRSAKYALMFIALTFVVFFFVEIFTKKSIHFFQYLLVGIALILFYSLLLSFSEQVGFGWAYLIASTATISMIAIYFYSLIRQKLVAFILAGILTILYAFLYIILQIQDFALLFGSVFLFVILGVIMFVSNKIKLGKQVEMIDEKPADN